MKNQSVIDSINEKVAKLIEARKSLKITQSEISRLSGLPKSTICRFEQMLNIPSMYVYECYKQATKDECKRLMGICKTDLEFQPFRRKGDITISEAFDNIVLYLNANEPQGILLKEIDILKRLVDKYPKWLLIDDVEALKKEDLI